MEEPPMMNVYRFPNSEGNPTLIPVDKDLKDLFDNLDDLYARNMGKDEDGAPSVSCLLDRLHKECMDYQKNLADHMTEIWRGEK